jgi:hypothetical protein
MDKVLKTQSSEPVESEKEEGANAKQGSDSVVNEISPVWYFVLPNNKFYVIIWKHPKCSYACRLLNDYEIELTLVVYPDKEDLKTLAEKTGIALEMFASFYTEKVFKRIIRSPKPLLQHQTIYTNEFDDFSAFSFPLKLEDTFTL